MKEREPEESHEGGHCRERSTGQGGLRACFSFLQATPGPGAATRGGQGVTAVRQQQAGPRAEASEPEAGAAQEAWGRGRKAASAILTITDVRFVVVFLRGGVVPPSATCGAAGLGRHGNIGMLVMLTITTVPEHVFCEALSASPISPHSTLNYICSLSYTNPILQARKLRPRDAR